jgi:pimeloyl-ACP methyl ester carboxylesterase
MPKTPIYFVPGLAAGREIFKNIVLPEDLFEVYIIEWIIPKKNEPLVDYAKRMSAKVTEPNAVLVGVSFGGVVAQEMSVFLALKKLIIISSAKTMYELPQRLKFAKKTGAYRLVPTRLFLSAKDLTKFSIGPKTKKRLALYQDYLHIRDKKYLDWAIKNMVCWQRKEAVPNVEHIHGDKDVVFPIKNIDSPCVIKGGSHVMIMYKAKLVSEMLINIIEK